MITSWIITIPKKFETFIMIYNNTYNDNASNSKEDNTCASRNNECHTIMKTRKVIKMKKQR